MFQGLNSLSLHATSYLLTDFLATYITQHETLKPSPMHARTEPIAILINTNHKAVGVHHVVTIFCGLTVWIVG